MVAVMVGRSGISFEKVCCDPGLLLHNSQSSNEEAFFIEGKALFLQYHVNVLIDCGNYSISCYLPVQCMPVL